MKCENCGKNDVTFVYQSNINGHVEEKHLCAQCAGKLGYTQRIAAHRQQMMQNFFGGNFFEDFFSPMPGIFGRMDRLLENPFDDFFSDMPALGPAPARQQEEAPAKKQDDLVEKEEQGRFARMRQLNALKQEMKKAVRQENFERAAELRDQIHALEAEKREEA